MDACMHPSNTVEVSIAGLQPGGRISGPKATSDRGNSTNVRALDLRGCQVGPDTVTRLSRGLTSNVSTCIVKLLIATLSFVVSGPYVDTCTRGIAKRFVTTITLSGNHLQDGDMALLASALVHNACLLELTLSYNAIGEDGSISLAKALAMNSHLRLLDLMHNRIGKDGITPWLGDTMRVNIALRELKLSHNAIGDKKAVNLLESLAPKPLTEEAKLKARIAGRRRHTTMADGSESHDNSEPFNSTLRSLLLSNTGISDEASPHLAHMLAHTRSLTHLDISCNNFTNEGNIAIARGLQRNSSLRHLNYRENKLEEPAALALLGALTKLSFIETALFQDCFGSHSAVGSALGKFTKCSRSLTTLDLVRCRFT
ncbi:unnamed protein product [Phytophthora fragariaefolia]|uniref:Unnamed protein product n=1 Tax=Phytophthora fragariaefolia TaxID=1490495 RepID=A0A9W6YHK7_9STRA|nr:unnamed protein product [Phytophthora fragariaefolia]